MQYAIIQNRVLSAEEYTALMTHGEHIADRTPEAGGMSLQLVYGALRPQFGETPMDAMAETRRTCGCWYGTIDGERCVLSTLVDIEFHDPLFRGHAVDVPFSALLHTDLDIGARRNRSIPLFVRYEGLSPAQNLLDRPAILCVCRSERRMRTPLAESGWRNAIDSGRAAESARQCR
ncbi:MAG: hypothetical protein F4X92_08150 [Gammaproteobacteria bacterium]|nr:hypothetical protein [Gammaproteobacteria bacterium]